MLPVHETEVIPVAFVLIAGMVARIAYEQTVNPSKPAQAQADLYDCDDFTY